MYVIQILLPTHDNDRRLFDDKTLGGIHAELVARFGGLTAYSRAPAHGTWAFDGGSALDDIVVVEVMTDTLDKGWWQAFRIRLEQTLRQQRVIIRAHPIELL
jgi:hypothetical protein